MAPDCEYHTLLNRVYAGIPAFCSDSFKTSIRSASDFSGEVGSRRNITLLLSGSNFGRFGVVRFRFRLPPVTSVPAFSVAPLAELEAAIWA